jgi:long-chain fatty acid transport protein
MSTIFKSSALAAAIVALSASTVLAGGYSRGSVNVSPLLGDGNTAIGSVTYVAPTRRVSTVNGAPAVFGTANADFAGNYILPSAYGQASFNNATCGVSYSQPYGANSEPGRSKIDQALQSGTFVAGTTYETSASLLSHEFGLTCSYGFDVGPGKLYAIGGAFIQQTSYEQTKGTLVPAFANNVASIKLDDTGYGYRAGIGYAVEEIALKTSLVYRSKVDHRVEGTQIIGIGPAAGRYQAFANATTPESLKFSFQTGVSKSVLVFGSVEWTRWSRLQQVSVRTPVAIPALGIAANAPTPGAPTIDAFFRDGWTISGGAAKRFNEQLAVLGSVTWDRGTGTGRSGFFDTWTVAAGASYDVNENVSLRAGAAYSFLNAGTFNDGALTIGYGNDYAIAGNLSLDIKF